MKAIVLSCDRYRIFARHTVAKYRELWPDHPFRFHIPYQAEPDGSDENIEWVPSPESIPATMETLLSDLPDDEWIYWCIDDKYPVQLKLEKIAPLLNHLGRDEFASVGGLAFCRCRSWSRQPETLEQGNRQGFLRRLTWHHIWLHQFLRVGVLRTFFRAMPEFTAPKEMDEFKFEIPLPTGLDLLVTDENHAGLGESTSRGKVTTNCAASLADKGITVAEEFLPPTEARLMGKLD